MLNESRSKKVTRCLLLAILTFLSLMFVPFIFSFGQVPINWIPSILISLAGSVLVSFAALFIEFM